ncbi:MAG: T9SS type A sorting domain-containing protein, partial [Planctomycetota bacterium]
QGNIYRWHQYQVNLFGDPEMACHTAPVTTMTLTTPEVIPASASQFVATVFDTEGPVVGARLCLAGPEVYDVGFSDEAGRVVFDPVITTSQALELTATAPNHVFAHQAITATGGEPFLSVTGTIIDDDAVSPSAGNADGEIGAGESVELFVTVHNYGVQGCTGVTGTLSADSPHTIVTNGTGDFGSVQGGGDGMNAAPFVFEVSAECPPGEVILFTLALEDDGDNNWVIPLPLTVVRPGMRFQACTVTEISGNGNGIVDPGETVALAVRVVNLGTGGVGPLTATLTSDATDVTVLQDEASTDTDLSPGESSLLSPPFEVRVEPDCPTIAYCTLGLTMTHDEGNDDDQFLLAIGSPEFTDDMENGQGGWLHSGANDTWHLTDHRQHSGTTSWYCGTIDHHYLDNTNATLWTPTFVAPENARLSFWCYADVHVFPYGTDGMHVQVWKDGLWKTVGRLGRGMVDWAEYSYVLEDLVPGSETRVRFRFQSDASGYAEGIYIDDVSIFPTVATDVSVAPPPIPLVLSPAVPNPTQSLTSWRLSLERPTRVGAAIYDLQGRLLLRLFADRPVHGEHEIRWDGLLSGGGEAPPGVYFLRLQIGRDMLTRKVVLVR